MLIKKNLYYLVVEIVIIWLIFYIDNLILIAILEVIIIFRGLSNLKFSYSWFLFSEIKRVFRVCCIFNREKDGKDVL